MESIEKRLVSLGYDNHEALQIIDFYERKGKTVDLIQYLNCMETCLCENKEHLDRRYYYSY